MADYKKPDYWQLKAQKEGYPARSVYKLQEMDEKFGLLKYTRSSLRILDLGAAPGSWSLYILRRMINWGENGDNGLLVSADLSPLSRRYDRGLFNSGKFCFIQGDIGDPVIRDQILSHGPYNLIISDAAPATTGNRSIDAARSLELAGTAAAYAGNALVKGGNLAIKVFQGGDTVNLLKHLRTLFKTAKSYKPQVCRNESFETYYIGLGKQ